MNQEIVDRAIVTMQDQITIAATEALNAATAAQQAALASQAALDAIVTANNVATAFKLVVGAGTFVIKPTKGLLHRVIINDITGTSYELFNDGVSLGVVKTQQVTTIDYNTAFDSLSVKTIGTGCSVLVLFD